MLAGRKLGKAPGRRLVSSSSPALTYTRSKVLLCSPRPRLRFIVKSSQVWSTRSDAKFESTGRMVCRPSGMTDAWHGPWPGAAKAHLGKPDSAAFSSPSPQPPPAQRKPGAHLPFASGASRLAQRPTGLAITCHHLSARLPSPQPQHGREPAPAEPTPAPSAPPSRQPAPFALAGLLT